MIKYRRALVAQMDRVSDSDSEGCGFDPCRARHDFEVVMKTILFDLDDTLIESIYVWENAITRLFEKLGIDMDFERGKKTFLTMRFSEVLVYIRKYFAAKMSIEEMNEFCMSYIVEEYKKNVPQKEGALEFIQQCAQKGIQMAVVTSNHLSLTSSVLERLGMRPYIYKIYSAEALHLTKREPEIYEMALKEMNADVSETLVFEDSMYAIQTATSLGIRCIGLLTEYNQKEFEENHVESIPNFKVLLEN